MEEKDVLTRKLFEHQQLFIPAIDSAAYKLKADLHQVVEQLLIISYSGSQNDLVQQREIFERMLSRLPDSAITSKIIFTSDKFIQLDWLTKLDKTEKILLCGIEAKHADKVIALHQNFSWNHLQILATSTITEIDEDLTLKKMMWSEWMKQFGK